ncbi:MAG TPA: sigma-70 family RNA polymerase sigma factor [Gemmataceae bacterium]|jgi:RNA polymerase sigma factor (sigma-70 family)
MTTRQAGTILRHIRNLVDAETARKLTDAQLLQRFAVGREETAFAALMQRHGGLVWGVCQHLLHQEQDAEDAFQATFLVLARRAGSIRKSEAVSSFLYGVAYRIAMKAKQNIRRRQAHERRASEQARVQPPADLAWRELQAVLDEEVRHLPERYRGPFILCCLEGRSQKEAARELDCKEGTVSSRIARARRLLQQRLTRRGVALSAALCASVLWKQTAAAMVPATLAGRTVQAATEVAGGVSATAAMLAEGVLRVMGFAKWQIGGALILGLSLLAVGAGAWSHRVPVMPSESGSKEIPASPTAARKDVHGDPLPPGALARFGTVRQRAPDSHLAVTADGKEVIAVSGGLTVRRFDARTGELRAVRQLPGATASRYWAWLSPRGTFVLAASISGTGSYNLDLWDLNQRKIRQTLPVHTPWGAGFSADERRVAVADTASGQTHRVLVWDLETSKSRVLWSEKKVYSQRYFEPIALLSPDGKRLVACHHDQVLRCWDVESGKLLWQSEKKIWSPFIFFSPDSRTVVTPGGIGVNWLVVWDAATGKSLEGQKSPPKEAICPIGFSPDGRFLAFQTGLEEVILWKPGEEKVAFRSPRPPHHRDAILFQPNRQPTNFAFTPDGKGFIRRAGALQRWNLDTGKPVYADTENWGHTGDVTRLVFSPNGRLLASSSEDQIIRLWDVSTARTVHSFPKWSDLVAFIPDGRCLLMAPSGLGKIALQETDVATGRPERGFELAERNEFRPSNRDKEIRVTEDGKKLLMLTSKNGRRNDESILTAWDTATGECLVHKRVPWGEESLLTADGQSVLAPDSLTGAVKLLAVDTGKPRWEMPSDRNLDRRRVHGCDLALSPDGRLMAAQSHYVNQANFRMEHGAIRVGDMATGRQLQKLSIEGPAVFAFSADSRFFAVADRAAIRLWETATWKEIGSISVANRDARPPDRACASSLAFSPDGRTLATGHADGTILLWDATLRGGGRGGPLTNAQREALWGDLIGIDAARAYAAVWRLADDPQPSVSFLKERLRPVPPIPPEAIRSLLDDLDSDRFKVREEAERKLRAFGERVISPLRATLKEKPSLERRRRIEALLEVLEAPAPLTGETLRAVRTIQALERIGSAEARKLLEELSQGVESARLTRDAKESLARQKKREER